MITITPEQLERHTITAGECPSHSQVVLVSSLKRLHDKNAAPAAPVVVQGTAEVYAVRYLSHWDGEGDAVYVLAWKHNGELVTHEGGVKISDLLEYQGDRVLNVWPLHTAPPAAEQPDSTTSDKYRSELYDEVWEKARSMGYGNVTMALADLESTKAADQPDAVRVPVETMRRIHRDLDSCQKVIWLAGCRPRGYGFDPAYVADAQDRLKEIDALLAGGEV